MAVLIVEQIVLAGLLAPTFNAAAGGGDTFVNDSIGGRTFVYIKNTDGTTTDVTFDDTGSVAPEGAEAFDADVKVTVAATTGEAIVGPFPTTRFTLSVAMTYEKVTGLTIAVLALPL